MCVKSMLLVGCLLVVSSGCATKDQELKISPFAVSMHHGFGYNATQKMRSVGGIGPNKALTTFHPGLFITKHDFTLFGMRDSFGSPAFGAYQSNMWSITESFKIGYSLGAYVRRTASSYIIDPYNYRQYWDNPEMGKQLTNDWQLMPVVAISANYNVSDKIFIGCGYSVALTHCQFGFRFK